MINEFPDLDLWEEQTIEEYEEYKEKHCICHESEECLCWSYEMFRDKKLDAEPDYSDIEQEGEELWV
jgi:hypothetical protein